MEQFSFEKVEAQNEAEQVRKRALEKVETRKEVGEEEKEPTRDDYTQAHEEISEVSLGEKYVSEHFHPHHEMPEEMPEALESILSKNFQEDAEKLNFSKRIYSLMREGTGSLLFPDHDWENDARYLSGASTNLAGGAGGSFESDVVHMFRTLSFFVEAEAGTHSKSGEIFESVQNSEDTVAAVKNYVENLEEIMSEYEHLKTSIEESSRDMEDMDEEGRRLLGKLLRDVDVDRTDISDIPNIVEESVKFAKENEKSDGIVWWVQIAIEADFFNDRISKSEESVRKSLLEMGYDEKGVELEIDSLKKIKNNIASFDACIENELSEAQKIIYFELRKKPFVNNYTGEVAESGDVTMEDRISRNLNDHRDMKKYWLGK